jgi:hypothetical protein
MPAKRAARKAARQPASDDAVSYDEFKDYEGRRYTGMKRRRRNPHDSTQPPSSSCI